MPVYQSGNTFNARCEKCRKSIGTSSVSDWEAFEAWVEDNHLEWYVSRFRNKALCSDECKAKAAR
jgi:hypothetical protein